MLLLQEYYIVAGSYEKFFLITCAFLLTLFLTFAMHSYYLGNALHQKALAKNKQPALNPRSLKYLKEHDGEGGEYLFHTFFGSRQYHFFWHQCLFIIMDNSLGPPYTKQLKWLKKVLRENHHKAKYTFLLMHRAPLIWKKRKFYPAFNNYLSFFLLLRKYRIDYIFSGHLHKYRREERKETVFISNGKEGSIGGFLQSKPNYLTLVEVGDNGIQDYKIPVYQSVLSRIYGWYIDTSVAHFYPWFTRIFS